MKNSFYIALIFILLGLIGVIVRFNLLLEDFQTQVAAEKIIQNEKIEELEKEIRILKTDVHIIQYGFESDKENDWK